MSTTQSQQQITTGDLARRVKILTGWVAALGILLLAALGGVGWLVNDRLQPQTAPLTKSEVQNIASNAAGSVDTGDALTRSDVESVVQHAIRTIDVGDALAEWDVKRIVNLWCSVRVSGTYSQSARLTC